MYETAKSGLVVIFCRIVFLYSDFITVLFAKLLVRTNIVAFQHHQDNAEDLTMADTDKRASPRTASLTEVFNVVILIHE